MMIKKIGFSVRQWLMVLMGITCLLVPFFTGYWQYQFLLHVTCMTVGVMFFVLADSYNED